MCWALNSGSKGLMQDISLYLYTDYSFKHGNNSKLFQHPMENGHAMSSINQVMDVLLTIKKVGYKNTSETLGNVYSYATHFSAPGGNNVSK